MFCGKVFEPMGHYPVAIQIPLPTPLGPPVLQDTDTCGWCAGLKLTELFQLLMANPEQPASGLVDHWVAAHFPRLETAPVEEAPQGNPGAPLANPSSDRKGRRAPARPRSPRRAAP